MDIPEGLTAATTLSAAAHRATAAGAGKIAVLCDTDREMMLEFSRRCVCRLNRHLPVRLFLNLFQPFLDANVRKEIEKDRLLIEHAAAAFDRGTDRTEVDSQELFEMTKKVDQDFVQEVSNPLFSIRIRYEDFADIRKKRIDSFVTMVYGLLRNWRDSQPFRDVVRSTFAEKAFHGHLREVLHLYNVETRLLSDSVTFHGPAGAVKDLCADRLFSAMEKAADAVAAEYAGKVYGGQEDQFASPGVSATDRRHR